MLHDKLLGGGGMVKVISMVTGIVIWFVQLSSIEVRAKLLVHKAKPAAAKPNKREKIHKTEDGKEKDAMRRLRREIYSY